MIRQERRLFHRKTVNPFPYINFSAGNGGIVLDISERGLRFRAVAPMEQTKPILFWFTAHSNLIAGIGEVVWTDETKRTVGLRFTQLPYNAQEQIRSWPEEAIRPSIGVNATLHISAGDSAEPRNGTSFDAAATRASDSSIPDSLEPVSFEEILRNCQLQALEDASATHEPVPHTVWRVLSSKAIWAAVIGLLILANTSAGRRESHELLVWLGTKVAERLNKPILAAGGSQMVPQEADASTPKASQDSDQGHPAALPAPSVPSPEPTQNATELRTPAAAEVQHRPIKQISSSANLVVQVAALTDESEAQKLTEHLRHQNFEAFVRMMPDDSFYRVVLGPFPDGVSARAMIAKLRKVGFSGFIRRENGEPSPGL